MKSKIFFAIISILMIFINLTPGQAQQTKDTNKVFKKISKEEWSKKREEWFKGMKQKIVKKESSGDPLGGIIFYPDYIIGGAYGNTDYYDDYYGNNDYYNNNYGGNWGSGCVNGVYIGISLFPGLDIGNIEPNYPNNPTRKSSLKSSSTHHRRKVQQHQPNRHLQQRQQNRHRNRR